MVRYVKLIFPYAKLAFIGWVVVASNAPTWQAAVVLTMLAWTALGIFALRVTLAAYARAYLAQSETTKLLRDSRTPVTKPRRRIR